MNAPVFMDSLHSKSIMQQLNEQALLSQFKERSRKQNNSLSINLNELNRNSRISSIAASSSKGKQTSIDSPSSTKFQFDKDKIEMNKNVIICLPQVSINQLTKMKNPSLIRQGNRVSFDYIEADKLKYNQTLKYLSQQKLHAAQRLQRSGSIEFRQRQNYYGSPSSKRNIAQNNQRSSMTPVRNSICSGGFNDSLNQCKTPQKRSLHITSSPQNKCDKNYHTSRLNNTQNQQNEMGSRNDTLQFKVDQIKNNFKRDSVFKRSSLNKQCTNLLRNESQEIMNRTRIQKNPIKERGSIFQSIFNQQNMQIPQAKDNSNTQQPQTNVEEQDTATSVKNSSNNSRYMNDFIRSRLGSTRRSSNISNLNNLDEDDKVNYSLNSRFSFLQSIPQNKLVFDKLSKDSEQFQQEVIKSLQEDKLTTSKGYQDSNKKEVEESQGIKFNEQNGFKKFAFKNFKANSIERLQTFFSFAFNSIDKSENKYIICALNELLDDIKKQGSMQIIDLWSAKSLKSCIERTNMGNEKFVVQQFLHYKAKFDNQKKKEQLKQSEILSLQKEQELKDEILRQELAKKQINQEVKNGENSFSLDDDNTQYNYNQQMLMNSGQYNLKYKKALNNIIEEIKDMKQENIEDIKNQKLLQKTLKTFSKELEIKYKLNKLNKK
ncbi:hypothetical protein ABPG72_013330 [Tetrahymena utriculariae]